MKILHVSYAHVKSHSDPVKWLDTISYFTGILTEMAKEHEVSSIHCLSCEGVVQFKGVTYYFFNPDLLQRLLPIRIHQRANEFDPNVIVIHGLHYPWQVIWLRIHLGEKVKLFMQHHAEKPLRIHKRLFQVLVDKFIKGYFFSSLQLGKRWVEQGQIQDISKIHEVMEVSSNFGLIDKNEAKTKVGMKGRLNYLWVGRLDKNKDPETLVKAFVQFYANNPSVSLYVVFQQSDLLPIIRPIAELCPDHIHLVGYIRHNDLLFWYNAADFIISTSHYEGSGVSVCEAMSCGCIPIVSNIPSFNMMTDQGQAGLLFEPGDATSLLKALVKSTTIDITKERLKVLQLFDQSLSFKAISQKLVSVFSA